MRIETLFIVLVLIPACTLEDGQPWGFVEAEIATEELHLGEAVEVDSFAIEVEGLRMLAADDQPAEEGGDCHGDHCHGANEASADHSDEGVVVPLAHFEVEATLVDLEPIELGEAAIGERASVERVELEVHELVVQGRLQRGDETLPLTIRLEHLELAGSTALPFGPHHSHHRHVLLVIEWPADWLEDVNISGLETSEDGGVLIGDGANPAGEQAIMGHLQDAHLDLILSHESHEDH